MRVNVPWVYLIPFINCKKYLISECFGLIVGRLFFKWDRVYKVEPLLGEKIK
jgi:hypothetical protein